MKYPEEINQMYQSSLVREGLGRELRFVCPTVSVEIKLHFGDFPITLVGQEEKQVDIKDLWKSTIIPVLCGEDLRWTYCSGHDEIDWKYMVDNVATAWFCYNLIRKGISVVYEYALHRKLHAVACHAFQMLEILPTDEDFAIETETSDMNERRVVMEDGVVVQGPLAPITSTQIGGTHYTDMAIQPIEFIEANNLGFMEGNIIKYAARHKAKNGAEDIRKIIHYAKLILKYQYGEE